jgi:hypothetical protein
MESGQTAEVSLIGREGLVCSGAVLDVQDAIDRATVEVGTAAFHISSTSFIRAYRSHDKLRTIVNRHHAMFIAEGRQSTLATRSTTPASVYAGGWRSGLPTK